MTTSAAHVGIYGSSRKWCIQNAASDGFGLDCSGAAFYLPHQLVGILLVIFMLWFVRDDYNDFGRAPALQRATQVLSPLLINCG